jgi:hypothetical protein
MNQSPPDLKLVAVNPAGKTVVPFVLEDEADN